MSTTRRKFLKAGMLAALFAAVPIKNVLGQGWKDRDGNPTDDQGVQNDPLANYTKATFKSYLNSVFQLHTVSGVVAVTLLNVDDMTAPEGGECFSLLFRGGSSALGQDTYTIDHAALGMFKLFLVPVGADSNGAQGYLATINRLSLSASLIDAPTRLSKPSVTMKPEEKTTPPSNTTTTPNINKPAETTTPARKTRPRKKPSWKSGDEDFEGEVIDQ